MNNIALILSPPGEKAKSRLETITHAQARAKQLKEDGWKLISFQTKEIPDELGSQRYAVMIMIEPTGRSRPIITERGHTFPAQAQKEGVANEG
jgi:hypothetical protein